MASIFATTAFIMGCGHSLPNTVPAPQVGPVRLDIEETDETGKVIAAGSFPYSFTDINSQLRLTPRIDSGAVRGGVAATDSTSVLLAALSDSLAALRAVLDRLDSVPEVTRKITALIEQRDSVALRPALALHARLVSVALGYLTAADPTLADTLLSRNDYSGVGAFLRGRAETLTQRVQEVGRTVGERVLREGVSVEVWAMLYSPGSAPAQVHIEGYDNLPSGDPTPVPKLGFGQTPVEQADIERATREYRQLVDAIDSVRAGLPRVIQDASTLIGNARAALQQSQRALKRLPTPKALSDSLRLVASDPTARQIAESIKVLATQLGPLETLRGILDTAVRRFERQPSPALGFQVFGDAIRSAGQSLSRLGDGIVPLVTRIPGDLPSRMQTWAQLLDDVAATAGPARASLSNLAQRMREDWAPAIDSILAVRDSYKSFQNDADHLLTLVEQTLPLFRGVAASNVPPDPTALLAIPVADAMPGNLDLTRSGPRDGDRIVATLRILESDRQHPLLNVERTVRVRTYGWHRRWQAGLAFTRESQADGVWLGVSLSWMVHYRHRPAFQSGRPPREGAPLLGFLDVGVGITSIAITRGPNVQLGFGPTVSLLSDALVIGGGFNFERQKGFLMFSTPLLDLVRAVQGRAEAAQHRDVPARPY